MVEETEYKYGIVYSAVTKSYTIEAIRSAKSVKLHNPEIPITLFTDNPQIAMPYLNVIFHKIIPIDMKPKTIGKFKLVPYAKLCKIRAMATFPYKTTLYLDTDTRIVKPIGELFTLQGDICIANSPLLDKTKTPFKLLAYVRPKAYNSGVIVYNDNIIVRTAFAKWEKKCLKDTSMYENTKSKAKFFDQHKLVKVINNPKSKIKLTIIPNVIYNARHTMLKKLKKDRKFSKVKIIHKH